MYAGARVRCGPILSASYVSVKGAFRSELHQATSADLAFPSRFTSTQPLKSLVSPTASSIFIVQCSIVSKQANGTRLLQIPAHRPAPHAAGILHQS